MATAGEMTLAIARVVGNELPPRDTPGSRIRALEHVIAMDRQLDAPVIWVLNHILSPDYRTALTEIFQRNALPFSELKFDREKYRTLSSDDERLRYAININAARNHALQLALAGARFVAVLDQDCFLTPELWQRACRFILTDQRTTDRQYYGLMMKRTIPGIDTNPETLPDQEPNVVFRNDASERFDESIPFGKNDKMALLHRLGYGDAPAYALTGTRCATAGLVLHVSYSDERIETDQVFRVQQRRLSLQQLLSRLT